MKKIILIAVFAIIGCTNNSESKTNNLTPKNLIGTWKFVGYYTANDIEIPNENFHSIENGGTTSYYDNNTFDSNIENTIYNGTYSISNDLVLNLIYNQTSPNGPTGGGSCKISLLSNTVLETTCLTNSETIDCEVYRFEKVMAP